MKIRDLVFAFMVLVVIATSVLGLYFGDRFLYNKAVNNPPNINEVEEKLEDIFLTRDVCVLNIEENGSDYIIYKVKANGFYYLVLYEITKTMPYYYWKYVRHTNIMEAE